MPRANTIKDAALKSPRTARTIAKWLSSAQVIYGHYKTTYPILVYQHSPETRSQATKHLQALVLQ